MNTLPELVSIPETYLFEQQHEVRTLIDEKGEVWVCAKDAFLALEITWRGVKSLETLPESWKLVHNLRTSHGEKNVLYTNEAGFYRIVFRSNKPKAEAFANWVCHDVLPAIRKRGYYGRLNIPVSQQIRLTDQLLKLLDRVRSTKDRFEYTFLINRIRTICDLLQEPIPDIGWIGQNRHQDQLNLN